MSINTKGRISDCDPMTQRDIDKLGILDFQPSILFMLPATVIFISLATIMSPNYIFVVVSIFFLAILIVIIDHAMGQKTKFKKIAKPNPNKLTMWQDNKTLGKYIAAVGETGRRNLIFGEEVAIKEFTDNIEECENNKKVSDIFEKASGA